MLRSISFRPKHEVGMCKSWLAKRKCKSRGRLTDLGNGLCMDCWDRKVAGGKQAYKDIRI